MSKKCRLCLRTVPSGSAIMLYRSFNATMEAMDMVKLIEKYLEIKVEPDDFLSTAICQACYYHLEEFHKFYRGVAEKQLTLQNDLMEANFKKESCVDDYGTEKTESRMVMETEEKLLQDEPAMLDYPIDIIKNEIDVEDECDQDMLQASYKDGEEDSNETINKRKMFNPPAIECSKEPPSRQCVTTATIEKLQKQMDISLQNQCKILAILNQFTNTNTHISDPLYFPIRDSTQLEVMDAELIYNKSKYLPIMKQILQPSGEIEHKGIIKNFHRLFEKEVLLEYNFDGVNNKKAFKQFENINEALFDIQKRNGYTRAEYISEIRSAFRAHKNRYHKNNYDARKKHMEAKKKITKTPNDINIAKL